MPGRSPRKGCSRCVSGKCAAVRRESHLTSPPRKAALPGLFRRGPSTRGPAQRSAEPAPPGSAPPGASPPGRSPRRGPPARPVQPAGFARRPAAATAPELPSSIVSYHKYTHFAHNLRPSGSWKIVIFVQKKNKPDHEAFYLSGGCGDDACRCMQYQHFRPGCGPNNSGYHHAYTYYSQS